MKRISANALIAALLTTSAPLLAAPNSVWDANASPALPLRYVESAPILRLAPQIANAETYAPKALFQHLYPSIDPMTEAESTTIAPTMASKTRDFGQIQPRGILSSSYVQELAYVDTYSNIRRYEDFFSFPSIRMSLAMPRFGNGFGGGYQPLQFGFGPVAIRFW